MAQLLEIGLFQTYFNAFFTVTYLTDPVAAKALRRAEVELGQTRKPESPTDNDDLTDPPAPTDDVLAHVELGSICRVEDGHLAFMDDPAGMEPAPLPQDRVSIALRGYSLDPNDASTLHHFAGEANDAFDSSAADGPINVDQPAAPPTDPDSAEAYVPATAGQVGDLSEGDMASSWVPTDLVPVPPPAAPPPFTADAYLFDMMNDSDASAAAQTVSNSIFATDWQVIQADMSDPSWSIWGVDATAPYSGTGGWF